jgi:hypothetical protein
LDSKVFQERSILHVRRVKRVPLGGRRRSRSRGGTSCRQILWPAFGVVKMTDAYWQPAFETTKAQKAAGRRAAEEAVFQKALAGLMLKIATG